MKTRQRLAAGVLPLLLLLCGAAAARAQLVIGGTTYTKWLWGNQHVDGSLYTFTTVPGEGYGDTGQGSEIELLLDAKVSKQVEVKGRLHSRFNQNEWTNYGGFGNPGGTNPPSNCIGGSCGEFDPRSNQYMKLRGVAVILTPGYKWVDSATIGANDFGQFDPWVVGRIRYIDRDNAAGVLFQGSQGKRRWTWDAVRISLPRLWAGPNFSTGSFAAGDASYAFQTKYVFSPLFDLNGIFNWVHDVEVDSNPSNPIIDKGRDLRTRFRNSVVGVKAGLHPDSKLDLSGRYYRSSAQSDPTLAPASFSGTSGFSPVPAGKLSGNSWKINADSNDPFGVGLSFALEYFNIGAQYVSMMAARRESDVLLTEGHDATFAFPGPSNAAFGVFGGNPTRIGYGGWDGTAQQIPTINVDNEFTDFDEPMAETVIGWKGITFVPTFSRGPLEISGEFTYLGYNTNWQAFGMPNKSIDQTIYPVMEVDTGVGHNFRSAYAPFQDKKTWLGVLKGKYTLEVGKGVDIFGKIKGIGETDNRLNDTRFLPYLPGDCPGNGQPCHNNVNFYSPGNTTSNLYKNPPVITVNGVTGYQWKPFDNINDDNRDLKYQTYQIGGGYQLTNDLYGSAAYEYYHAKLQDGDTAFQAYNLHEMASGVHDKNKVILKTRYILAGVEFGFEYQYNFGTFTPDFGGGFVTQFATSQIAHDNHVRVGSPGFVGRFGGWNSLAKRDFKESRLKGFMKVQF